MNNILLCSAGRRVKLIQQIKKSLNNTGKVIAVDINNTAPALYFADKSYIVPRITDDNYINILLDICSKENIRAITTLFDPEIEILAKHKHLFEEIGVLTILPSYETSRLCIDKFSMYEYLLSNNIQTIKTYNSLALFKEDLEKGKINFPVFIKPRFGSGSIGARKVETLEDLIFIFNRENIIIQELMTGKDIGVDVYIDCISKEVVSIYSKHRIEIRDGVTIKSISFKDEKLFNFIKEINKFFDFKGPLDMEFFYQDGKYYLSEINPRFSGSYIHAYASDVDFVPLITNNINGIKNVPNIGLYQENNVVMYYDDLLIKKQEDLVTDVTKPS